MGRVKLTALVIPTQLTCLLCKNVTGLLQLTDYFMEAHPGSCDPHIGVTCAYVLFDSEQEGLWPIPVEYNTKWFTGCASISCPTHTMFGVLTRNTGPNYRINIWSTSVLTTRPLLKDYIKMGHDKTYRVRQFLSCLVDHFCIDRWLSQFTIDFELNRTDCSYLCHAVPVQCTAAVRCSSEFSMTPSTPSSNVESGELGGIPHPTISQTRSDLYS